MTAIENLNSKSIKDILTEVRERFDTRANWQTNALSSPKGCMCLLGGLSVAEGIVTVDDYLTHYQSFGVLKVGEFADQAAIYRALAESRALKFLMDDIATENAAIANAIAKAGDSDGDEDEDEPAGMHYVDAAWTYNDGHDRSNSRDKDASYHRLLNALDHAIARA